MLQHGNLPAMEIRAAARGKMTAAGCVPVTLRIPLLERYYLGDSWDIHRSNFQTKY